MNERPCSIAHLEAQIRSAFCGAVLGDGVSIQQSEVMARYGEGCTDEAFDALPRSENTSDWTSLPPEELDLACVAFFDPAAFRFYIPALMLNLLARYAFMSFGMIGTLRSLCPEPHRSYGNAEALTWALLNQEQRAAVGSFMRCLPVLVQLDREDEMNVQRSFARYWHHHVSSIGQ